MLWKVVAALGVILVLFNIIVGGVVLILAVLLYMVQQRADERDQAELRQAMERRRTKAGAQAPPAEPLPADGSMPVKRPGETDAAWAARVQAAEAAAFKQRTL